ncbi:DHH phosphoesterase [Pleurotus eryngii]|uniref:DHH phosphoesterase n=1 Tax=Pleurotus eryngii TaxID=5323 RepID=A0A9P6D3P9_PLEER|nr:DHH phosphoesterase [Pleurotus eryngii]
MVQSMFPKSSTKRALSSPTVMRNAKKPHLATAAMAGVRDVLGEGRWKSWPAPAQDLKAARVFMKQCRRKDSSAGLRLPTIIVPDKDADGLSSGLILYRTLSALGLPPESIHVHFIAKGASVFSTSERARLECLAIAVSGGDLEGTPSEVRVIYVDQGSRGGPPLLQPLLDEGRIIVRTMVIDHHQSEDFPEGSQVLTACKSPPICTSSLLAYLMCYPLESSIPEACAWLALLGIFGDLGPSEIKFGDSEGDWPVSEEMLRLGDTIRVVKKKALSDAVSLLNAPRRTPEFDVQSAWDALLSADGPTTITNNRELRRLRFRINEEVERCSRAAPRFSKDGCVALLRVDSQYQVHPVVAIRWASRLKGKDLKMIMVVNPSHHPDPNLVSFSCRIPASLRKVAETAQPNLQQLLKGYAAKVDAGFLTRVGGDYARGHKQATGGIIPSAEFELLVTKGMEIMAKSVRRVDGGPVDGQRKIKDFFSKG